MIKTYHRPQTMEEALALLAQPHTLPLGGGTALASTASGANARFPLSVREDIDVVDLQALGLDTIGRSGNHLELGATVTLQSLLESEHCPAALKSALRLEAPLNIRNTATVAGTLVACDGRSTFATVLLALDAKLEISEAVNQSRVSALGDFLPLRPRGLITAITIPLNVKLAFDYVARTPSDKPIVCVAVAGWGSGRTRVAVGGYGQIPMLAMDGVEESDASTTGLDERSTLRSAREAVRNSFHEAADEWGSAEYRMDVAATLVKRCLEALPNSSAV
jgi:CO/xanthine dehydrogenase FAD-binding subunit